MSKGKIIEVNLKYCDHIVVFLYNVKSLKKYKESREYKIFMSRFGDQLRENIHIEDNSEYTQPDANIFLSITQSEPSFEDFEMFVKNCLMLFDIPSIYSNKILEHILISYPKNEKNMMYHNIAIVNNFSNPEKDEQYILFEYMTVSKKNIKEYNYMTKDNNVRNYIHPNS